MDFKDYYKVLGVERTASDDEVRKAYRKLARKYHPDVSKEADAQIKMRDLNEAKDVLGDKEKRAAYDALAERVARGGSAAGDGNFQPPPGWDQGYEFHRGPGQGRRHGHPQRRRDRGLRRARLRCGPRARARRGRRR